MNLYLQIILFSSFAIVALYVAGWMISDISERLRRWRQRRLVAALRREHWKRFDAAALVKAKILAVGHVYDFTDAHGKPLPDFAFCGCWNFDQTNGSMTYSVDSKGVIRMFGYTKEEAIYIAEHAKEFVDA